MRKFEMLNVKKQANGPKNITIEFLTAELLQNFNLFKKSAKHNKIYLYVPYFQRTVF